MHYIRADAPFVIRKAVMCDHTIVDIRKCFQALPKGEDPGKSGLFWVLNRMIKHLAIGEYTPIS